MSLLLFLVPPKDLNLQRLISNLPYVSKLLDGATVRLMSTQPITTNTQRENQLIATFIVCTAACDGEPAEDVIIYLVAIMTVDYHSLADDMQ